MTGLFNIDGKDAYRELSVFIVKDGYNALLAYPPLKKVERIDWQEEDGEQVDLAAPVLDSRELSISFATYGRGCVLEAFIALLSDGAYHVFEFWEIGRTCRLRLVSQPNLTLARQLGLFSLLFAADFPLDGYTYQAPLSTLVEQPGYAIDGVRLSQYGLHVLQGSREQIEKSPAVKKNLLRNIESQAGVIYDGNTVRFQAKEVKLACLMRARTFAEFWRNYDALLFDLTRPGERRFVAHSVEYRCYYKSSSTVEFAPANGVWFKFSLVLVFTLNR